MIRSIIGALLGGVVGVVIWLIVTIVTQMEFSLLAIGIGALVGLGARLLYAPDDDTQNMMSGFTAGGVAVGSIVLAKWLIFLLIVSGPDTELVRTDDEAMIARMVHEENPTMMPQGSRRNAPEFPFRDDFISLYTHSTKWDQFEQRWQAMSPQEQEIRRGLAEMDVVAAATVNKPHFGEMFSWFDLIWFVMAASAAFGLASGARGE